MNAELLKQLGRTLRCATIIITASSEEARGAAIERTFWYIEKPLKVQSARALAGAE